MAAIYFDLDGTLITYGKDFHDLFEAAMGFQVDKEVHEYRTEQLLGNIKEMKEKPYRNALEKVEEKYELGIDPEKAAERRIETELDSVQPHQELVNVLKKLSENHKIGILTNGVGEVQRKKIEKLGIEEHVDEIIISNPEGVRKPDPKIFQLAKERLNAENYIYIGDTYEEDILPAKEQGFKTIYVSGEKEADLQAQSPEKVAEILKLVIR